MSAVKDKIQRQLTNSYRSKVTLTVTDKSERVLLALEHTQITGNEGPYLVHFAF